MKITDLRATAVIVPRGPGLGVALDREKLGTCAGLSRRLGSDPYDRDPGRPGWYPPGPNAECADPAAAAMPARAAE